MDFGGLIASAKHIPVFPEIAAITALAKVNRSGDLIINTELKFVCEMKGPTSSETSCVGPARWTGDPDFMPAGELERRRCSAASRGWS